MRQVPPGIFKKVVCLLFFCNFVCFNFLVRLKKKRMQSQMAEEIVDEMQNQRRKRMHVNDTNEEDNQEENSDIEEGAEEIEDIWIGWKKLLKGLEETVALPFLSPERHDIIWCGKELRRRPLFPADMYERLINKNINIDLKVVDRLFQSAVSQATDAIDIEGFKSGIENLKSIVTTTSHYRAEVQCIANIPNVGDSFTANQINKWLISDGNFGRPKSTRQGCDVIKARDLWVLKPEFMGDAMDRTLNRKTFRQMTRQITGWITAGYCRKSPSKETPQKRLELLQKMVNSLHVNDLCEKVFFSPICRASSDLLTRDISPTTTAQSILKQLRFQNGDMQDFLMFAKTMTSSIRLVVLDYAGLCTNPIDIRTFVKDVKTIEQIVIDHGHKLESFNRAELNNRKVISKFDCCKTSVKRSSL